MQLLALVTCVLTQSLLTLSEEVDTKYIKVDKLDRWKVLDSHNDIYGPLSSTTDGKSASHSVHVSDNSGKYLKLDYSMNHPSDASFLKLETEEHSSKISSITCDNDNELTLHFKDKSTMRSYYKLITNRLHTSTDNNNYYIVGSHLWKCRDFRNNKYYPIMRKIESVSDIDSDTLTVELITSYATYLDVFDNLNMKFETNMKLSHDSMSTYKTMAKKIKNNKDSSSIQQRRLLSWLSDAWDDVVDGVETVVDDVVEVVDDVVNAVEDAWDDLEDVVDALEGKNVTFTNSSDYMWSYNYNQLSDSANGTFYLDDDNKVNCLNCYAYFDLVYTYEVEIYDRKLYRLYMVGDGEAKINVEIEMEVSYSYEYDFDTPDIPIPYLSVDVFGIDFGFVIYGEIGVGVYIEMDYIYVGAMAYGSITRGIEYYAPETPQGSSNSNGTMQYVTDESFEHTLTGPKLEFSSANITFYLKPTLYLELTYVGSVYFGIQPEIELSLTRDSATNSTDCAIDYIPTAKLLAFVGANLNPLDLGVVWKKEISLNVVQFVLTTLEGCITEAEVTKIESYIDELDDALSSRRLLSDSSSYSNFYLDYTTVSTDRYSNKHRWGKVGTEWWGNLTTLNGSGNAQDIIADNGKLLLKIRANGGDVITGVYITEIDDWYLPPLTSNDTGFITNVSCVSRIEFTKANSTYNGLFSYNTKVLEYRCDVSDEYSFAGNEDLEHTFLERITLTGNFYALMLDTHFHSGFLFDENFDRLFALSRKRKHENAANASLTTTLPSKGWFGEYHCVNGSTVHVTCTFQSWSLLTGDVSAVLEVGGETYWLYGSMSWTENRLNLVSTKNNRVSLDGYLTLLDDGTILYTGPAISDEDDCTGFVLQGYMDTSQLDSQSYDNNNNGGGDDVTIETVIDDNKLWTGMFYGGLIALGLVALICSGVMIGMKQKGYKFFVKQNDQPMGYEMMDGQL